MRRSLTRKERPHYSCNMATAPKCWSSSQIISAVTLQMWKIGQRGRQKGSCELMKRNSKGGGIAVLIITRQQHQCGTT